MANTLELNGWFPNDQRQLDWVVASLRQVFSCTKASVYFSLTDPQWARIVPLLGLQELPIVYIDFGWPAAGASDLTALAQVSGVESITLKVDAGVSEADFIDTLASVPPGLASKLLINWPKSGKIPFATLTKAFPTLTSLSWTVSEETTWNPNDIKAWSRRGQGEGDLPREDIRAGGSDRRWGHRLGGGRDLPQNPHHMTQDATRRRTDVGEHDPPTSGVGPGGQYSNHRRTAEVAGQDVFDGCRRIG